MNAASAPPGVVATQFDAPVPAGGYRWWYIDATSTDHSHGLVLIVFAANPFSPFYRGALRGHAAVDPHDYAAVNAVLYRGRRKLWTMTEFDHTKLARSADAFTLASNELSWLGDTLHARFSTRSPLLGVELRGTLVLHPHQRFSEPACLIDGPRPHFWQPLCPSAAVEVHLEAPRLAFRGNAYCDTNWGASLLTEGFDRWDWQRSATPRGTAIVYAGQSASGQPFCVKRLHLPDGSFEDLPDLDARKLPLTRWGLRRTVYSAAPVLQHRAWESAPFYARTHAALTVGGSAVFAVSETMDLRRLRRRWVQAAFYLRMRRAGRGLSAERARLALFTRSP